MAAETSQATMEAVIFNGPFKIDVERRPLPVLETATDAVVKVTLAGICGSELHMYRGHQDTAPGHIMVRRRNITMMHTYAKCHIGS